MRQCVPLLTSNWEKLPENLLLTKVNEIFKGKSWDRVSTSCTDVLPRQEAAPIPVRRVSIGKGEWPGQWPPSPQLLCSIKKAVWKLGQNGRSTEAKIYYYRFVYTNTFFSNSCISETKQDFLNALVPKFSFRRGLGGVEEWGMGGWGMGGWELCGGRQDWLCKVYIPRKSQPPNMPKRCKNYQDMHKK